MNVDRLVIFVHNVLTYAVEVLGIEAIHLLVHDRTLAHSVGLGRVPGHMRLKIPNSLESMWILIRTFKCMTR